eukprot:symbB.v1.2.041384.t1/scaffold8130.1/size7575/1
MVIGMRVMHKVTGSLASHLQNLTTLDAIVFIVAYHSDLRRMIQEGHLHDAHAGNVLLSSSSAQDRPIFRWRDFGQSFTKRHDPEELGRMAGQVLKVTRDIVDLLHQKESSLGVILNKTQFRCNLLQASHQGTRHVQECLAERAVKLGSDIMTSALDTDVKEEFLAIVSPALPDYARRKSLGISFTCLCYPLQGTSASKPKAFWVTQLHRDRKHQDNDGEIKEADTAPFKIKESVSDVLTSAFVDLRLLKKFPVFSFHFAWDDFGFQARLTTSKKPSAEKECVKLFSLFCWVHLRGLEIVCHCITEAIKRKSPSTGGRWEKEDEDVELNRGSSKSDCYGYLLPNEPFVSACNEAGV